MSSGRTHYEILNIAVDVSHKQITAAYRQLAVKYHPDKNPDRYQESENEFKMIAEAYRVLGNANLRADYDVELKNIEVDVFEIVNEVNIPAELDSQLASNTQVKSDAPLVTTSTSLVVKSAYDVKAVMHDAGINTSELFIKALNNVSVAKFMIADIGLANIYADMLANAHEEIAVELLQQGRMSQRDKLSLANKFSSFCLLVIEDEKFIGDLSAKEAYDLYKRYNAHDDIRNKLEAELALLAKIKQYQHKKDGFDIKQANKIDSKEHRELITEWLIEHDYKRDELVELAKKDKVIAHAILDSQQLCDLLHYNIMVLPDLAEIALIDEAIALRLINENKHWPMIKGIYFRYFRVSEPDSNKGNKTAAYWLANQHASIHQALINSELLNQLPLTEIIELTENTPIAISENVAKKISAYQLLQGDLSKNSNEEITETINNLGLSSQELTTLAKEKIAIAEAVIENEILRNLLGHSLFFIGSQHEKIAKQLVSDKKCYLLLKQWYEMFGFYINKWKSVCCMLLQDTELNQMLSGSDLYSIQRDHGVEIAKLIAAAGLQKKLCAYALFEKAKNQPGGLGIKKSNQYTKRQGEGELLYQLAMGMIEDRDKADLADEYILQAAKKGYKGALEFAIKKAEQSRNLTQVLSVVELCCMTGNEELAERLFKKISITPDKLPALLKDIEQRLRLAENAECSVTIGNFYYDKIVELMNLLALQGENDLDPIFRCLANMFEKNEPAIALGYLRQINETSLTAGDWLKIGNLALGSLANELEADVLVEQPHISVIELRNIMKAPDAVAKRYQAALPCYLKAKELDDIQAGSIVERMLKELVELNIKPDEKIKLWLQIGWQCFDGQKQFTGAAKIVWEKAKACGSEIGKYLVENIETVKNDTIIVDCLRLISQRLLDHVLPIFNQVQQLPIHSMPIKSVFKQIISEELITEATLAKFETRLEQHLTGIRKLNERLAKNSKQQKAVKENILNVLEDVIKGLSEDTNEGAIRRGIIRQLRDRLSSKVDEYYSQDFTKQDAPMSDIQLRTDLIAIINDQLNTINHDLKEHAPWYITIAYAIVRALHYIFPCVGLFTGWMNSFNGSYKVIPSVTEGKQLTDALVSGLD